jgi:hypothetical protein
MSSATPTLAQMQEWLCYTLTDSRGIQGSLDNSKVSDEFKNLRQRPKESLATWIVNEKPLTLQNRLEIYSYAYFARLCDVLAADLEFTRLNLGENNFRYWVGRFLTQTGSKTPIVDEISQSFAEFLRLKEPQSPVSCLAKLEAAEVATIFAPLPPPMTPEKIACLTDEAQINDIVFHLSPATQWVVSSFDMTEVWKLREQPEQLETLKASGDHKFCTLVVRNKNSVIHVPLNTKHEKIYDALKAGLTLGEICTKLFPTEEEAQVLMPTFGDWLQRGIITDLSLKQSGGI